MLMLVNIDAWDGYKANRLRILECLYNNSISNTIILSGDSHANWVSDLSSEHLPPASFSSIVFSRYPTV